MKKYIAITILIFAFTFSFAYLTKVDSAKYEFPVYSHDINLLEKKVNGEKLKQGESAMAAKQAGKAAKEMLESGYIIEELLNQGMRATQQDVVKWHKQIVNDEGIEDMDDGHKKIKTKKWEDIKDLSL